MFPEAAACLLPSLAQGPGPAGLVFLPWPLSSSNELKAILGCVCLTEPSVSRTPALHCDGTVGPENSAVRAGSREHHAHCLLCLTLASPASVWMEEKPRLPPGPRGWTQVGAVCLHKTAVRAGRLKNRTSAPGTPRHPHTHTPSSPIWADFLLPLLVPSKAVTHSPL